MKGVTLISMVLIIGMLYACDSVTDFSTDTSDHSTTINTVNNESPNTSSTSLGIPGRQKGLALFRRATARYHNVDVAIEEGFEEILPCTENPEGSGGLGVVYANLERFDTNIDLNEPEVLFYEPQQNGKLRLVGGEPVVPIQLWDESNPPSLFGREFHRNEEHGLYGLHMWIWKHNSDGVFAFWHPDISCEYAQ